MYQVLNDFRKLSPPANDEVQKRAKKVRDIIEAMGDKYLLASNIKRKTNESA